MNTSPRNFHRAKVFLSILGLFLSLIFLPSKAQACSFFVSDFCEVVNSLPDWEHPGILIRATVLKQENDRAKLRVEEYFIGNNVPEELWVLDLPTWDCNGAIFESQTEYFGEPGSEILAVLTPELDDQNQPTNSGLYQGSYLISTEYFLVRQGDQFVSAEQHRRSETKASANRLDRYLSNCSELDLMGKAPGQDVTVGPVPTQEVLNFYFEGSEQLDIEILDLQGRVCFIGSVSPGSALQVSDFAEGLYFIHFPRNRAMKPRKWIKL